jgi:hypothetical protein
VQEYLFARHVVKWCRKRSVDPEKIQRLMYVESKTDHFANSYAMKLLQGRKVRNVHAVQISLKRHRADERDRVYGLLAPINREERVKLQLRPNSSASVHGFFFKLYEALKRSKLDSPAMHLDINDSDSWVSHIDM